MRSVNKAIVSGHLGADPEENGAVKFSLAVNDEFTSEGEKQQRTNWLPIVCFGKTGELAKTYLHKGSHVIVEGQIRQNVYEPPKGKKQTRTEIVATSLIFLDKKNGD